MPLIAHSTLPSFERLKQQGETILSIDRAAHQDIRELHIGLLNMMPDSALEATERQFFRLIVTLTRLLSFTYILFLLKALKEARLLPNILKSITKRLMKSSLRALMLSLYPGQMCHILTLKEPLFIKSFAK